jgi:NAD(P)-dependent dehydrogenase (short-subunit alcohol dehydrogenase family)
MSSNNGNRQEVVVITGASAGVGRATARAFAKRGARIGLLARGKDGLEGACADVENAGGEALAVPTDVAHSDEVEAAAEAVEKRFGPINIWVNNAMTTVFAPFKEITAEEFKRATEVTYLGAVYGTMAALRRMYPRNRGPSCKSARHWHTGPSPCRPLTVARSMRLLDLPILCDPS